MFRDTPGTSFGHALLDTADYCCRHSSPLDAVVVVVTAAAVAAEAVAESKDEAAVAASERLRP